MKSTLYIILLLLFICPNVMGQEKKGPTKEIPKSLKSILPYGTFEYAFGANKKGWGVVDIIPRIGVEGRWAMDDWDGYYIFTKAELGLHLTSKENYIQLSSDPGIGYGKLNTALFARQGFIGVNTPYGLISIGKQWGVHYNLAGNIDNMYIFGGVAIGVYNAGTDGGLSGTGRADQAVKYEFYKDNFYIGIQGQFRNLTDNNKYFADAYSVATYYDIKKTVKLGVSYSKVLDGIANPSPKQPIIDDEMLSFLVDFNKNNLHFGIMGIFFNNHEKTNDSTFYNGWGIEYNLKYNFGKDKKWSFVNNTSIMFPYANQDMKYAVRVYSFELARRFSKNTVIIAGLRYDNGTLNSGDQLKEFTYALGFYYNFNYPVP